jgi:hypothetical protein
VLEFLVNEFIGETDLHTFEGWLKYQAVDAEKTAPEELEKWRRDFESVRERARACPKVGLMKLQPFPGEHRYAVAIEDGANLWLTLWVRCSRNGEFFVMLPRGDRDWDPHASYHSDGTLHIKSFGDKVIQRKGQPLTNTFRGSEDLGFYAGHGPKGVGAICDPSAFSGIARVAPGVLGPKHGVVKVDLVEPCHQEMECPEVRFISRHVFCDVTPRVAIRIGSYR